MKSHLTKMLCCFSIAGVFATAATSSIATKKALKILELKENRDLDKNEKVKLVAKYYIPPILIIFATSTTIVASEHINGKIIASTAASFALLKKSYDKYGEAVKRAFGSEGFDIVKKEYRNIDQKNKPEPEEEKEVYYLAYGYDDYFLAKPSEIEMAEAQLNKLAHHGVAVSVADFMDMLNIEPSSEAISIGWSRYELMQDDDEWIELKFNTIDSDGDHPAQEIIFSVYPSSNFEIHQKWFVKGEPTDRTMAINDGPPWEES